MKAYLVKGGCVEQKERNSYTSPSDVFAKIGQAICAILNGGVLCAALSDPDRDHII